MILKLTIIHYFSPVLNLPRSSKLFPGRLEDVQYLGDSNDAGNLWSSLYIWQVSLPFFLNIKLSSNLNLPSYFSPVSDNNQIIVSCAKTLNGPMSFGLIFAFFYYTRELRNISNKFPSIFYIFFPLEEKRLFIHEYELEYLLNT